MAALFGHIGEFIQGREQWPQYVECLKHFLAANRITNAKRKRYFSGSNWAECLQAVVEFGGAREAGGEDISTVHEVSRQKSCSYFRCGKDSQQSRPMSVLHGPVL